MGTHEANVVPPTHGQVWADVNGGGLGGRWRGPTWLSIFSMLNPDSPRLWLGSFAARLQRRWAGAGGSPVSGLSRDSAGRNLTPPPPPGQLLQSIRRGPRGRSARS